MSSINLWRFPALDPYWLLRPLLFQLDPEKAHTLALTLLEKGLGPKAKNDGEAILHTTVCGLKFPNPLGLAAGFDKNARAISDVLDFGFGFVEIGSITPLPQPGNPQPRLFRAVEPQAVINRLGFNNEGMDACLQRLKAWHDETQPQEGGSKRGIVGINLGKNRDSEHVTADYVIGFKKIAPYADYITINISSPNTPELRELQGREQLTELLREVTAARAAGTHKPPLFVKIAPDLTEEQQEDVAAVALAADVQGLIIGNTTIARLGNLPPEFAREQGGLSGKPLFYLSTRVLAQMYKLTQGKIALIGSGGVSSGADAYAKIRAGASLVQLYSALIFNGPGLVPVITRELAALLERDGFKSVSEAVGVGQ